MQIIQFAILKIKYNICGCVKGTRYQNADENLID